MSQWGVDREAAGLSRVHRVIALTALLMLILVFRLFNIQVLRSGGYLQISRDNQFRELRIPAPRGLILDRHGHVLGENMAACEASLATRTLDRHPEVIDELARILGRPREQIAERLRAAEGKTRVTVEQDLSKQQILILEERLPELPGLVLRDWARRTYPRGKLAAHMLGYVGEAGEAEVNPDSRDAKAYNLGDLIGRAGVEQTYEKLLRGTDGKELTLVNARGDQLESVRRYEPVAGNRLVLTLDLTLTAALDSALAFWGAGSGVVLDVHTGEILAAASRPAYDPNLLVGGIPARLWQELTEDPSKPLFNRVCQATYSPGSVFKPLIALQALESGAIDASERLRPCNGGLRLGRRFFRCWEPGGHGSLGMVGALEQSCDVYFYQLGERIGIEAIARAARRFGLGGSSGIDLASEARGLVPDSKWYDKRYGEGRWTRGNIWNVAIGQGEVLVSCLQMARAYAALANGGFLPVPRLRHHVEDENGEILIPFSPSRGERINLNAAALGIVQEGLRAVLHGEMGTARSSRLPDFVTAGKTGTVQNPHGTEHAWFCGYAPAEDPEIAIAVIVEHGEHGSDIAPIFRQLVAICFDLDVTPLRRGRRSAATAREGD